MKKKVAMGVFLAIAVLSTSSMLYAGGTQFLADQHKAEGIECADCHGKDIGEMVANQSCLACHESFEKVAERTTDMHINPHRSIHFMDYVCAACHQGHKPLNNFCQNCHGPIVRHK